eukprot:scaffold1665_cov135-Skeletonema_marinoi.AAC.2
MQQHIARPKRPTAVALAYPSGRSPPSPVLTMHQAVSSSTSPVFIATPTGRSSTMFATSKTEFSAPIFSLPSNIGVGEKAVNSFSPALRGASPTSVATSLATPRMGGISRGPHLPGGIVGIRRSYDHGSPSSEKVFEPVDRESQRRVPMPMPMPMTCSPCRNINQDDTADVDVTSPTAAASVASSPHITGSAPFLKLRKGGDRLGGSSNRSSHGRRRASMSTLSPASSSPTPQNLKDNPERLAKVKTEMCRYYELGGLKNCPWGDKCNYAHGKLELKFNHTTLTLMERSGQIANAKTYLSRPCMIWISTGACPYGRRCPAIHDPSITGPLENPSWLPAASAKTNAQIIVDRFAAHRDSAVHQENPLIAQGIWENCRPSATSQYDCGDESEVSWLDTYALVCNMGVPTFGSWPLTNTGSNENAIPSTSSSKKLSDLQKLCIVSQMRGQDSCSISGGGGGSQQLHLLHRDYIYAPTHSLHSELCMILQTRYFLLLDEEYDNNQGSIAAAVDKHDIVKEF